MSWIILALLVPFIYAIITLIDNNLLSYVYRSPKVAGAISGVFGVLPAAVLLIIADVQKVPINLALLAVGTGILTVIAYFLYFQGLSTGSPSVIAALMSLSPAIIPFIAYFFLDERLSLASAIGFAIVIIGAFCYSMVEIGEFRISKSLLPVLLAGLSLDFAAIINKYVYSRTDFLNAYFYYAVGLVIAGTILTFLFNKTDKKTIATFLNRRYILLALLLVIVEIMSIIAIFAFNKAISMGPLSLVVAIENITPIFVLMITLAFFKLAPHFFLEAKSPGIKTKILLSIAIIFGVFVAVRG